MYRFSSQFLLAEAMHSIPHNSHQPLRFFLHQNYLVTTLEIDQYAAPYAREEESFLITSAVGSACKGRLLEMLQAAREGFPAQEFLQFEHEQFPSFGLLTIAPAFENAAFSGYHCLLYPAGVSSQVSKLENKLHTFLEHVPDCIKIISPDGRITDINPVGVQIMCAQAREELIGFEYCKTVVPDDIPLFTQLLQQAFAGKNWETEFRFYDCKGQLKWVQSKSAPLYDENQQVYAVLLISQDITSHKLAEEHLIASKQLAESHNRKMVAIAESMLDCVFTTDKKGRVDYCNSNAEKLVGMPRESFLGKDFREVMKLADADEYTCHLEQALDEKVPIHYECFYRKAQRWLEVNIYSFEGGIAMTIKDISERKEAALKLKLSEQRFKSMVQKGSDIIAIIDEAGYFSYISPNSFTYAGYTPEELLGKNFREFIHPEDLKMVQEELHLAVYEDVTHTETSHRFLHREGYYIWLESKATNLLQENTIQGIIINARDITRHKVLEAQLAAAVQNRQKEITTAVIKAQERERSQIGQELHDNVNQILTTVKLYVEMMQQGIGEGSVLASRSIHHLQSCITEIRSISKRLSAPTLGQISFTDSITDLVQSVNLTKRLRVLYDLSGLENLCISQDLHLAIYRIIQEQLNNILNHAQAETVQIKLVAQDQSLLLTIEDDGTGFVPAHKTSGIGITNMRTRAEGFNGTFHISGQAGKGCLVEVRIPVAQKNNEKDSHKGQLVSMDAHPQHAAAEPTESNPPTRLGVVLPFLQTGKV